MEKEGDQKPFVPKSAVDFQRLKLERLMANPEKPVIIPEPSREKKGFTVPEFVRNVMGSSAGAGSGEFHVYRHLRRKEYTRQKMIDEMGEKERLDYEHYQRMEENKRKLEEKTAKKRAKRLKRKQNAKVKRAKKGESKSSDTNKSESESDSDETSEKEDSDKEQCEQEKGQQNPPESESNPKENNEET